MAPFGRRPHTPSHTRASPLVGSIILSLLRFVNVDPELDYQASPEPRHDRLGRPNTRFQVARRSGSADRGLIGKGVEDDLDAGLPRTMPSLLRKEPCRGVAW